MKITEVNVYFVRPRWGFVEIITDGGLSGWGEAVLEGHAKAVLACVEEYRDYLIGQDPSRIEDMVMVEPSWVCVMALSTRLTMTCTMTRASMRARRS